MSGLSFLFYPPPFPAFVILVADDSAPQADDRFLRTTADAFDQNRHFSETDLSRNAGKSFLKNLFKRH